MLQAVVRGIRAGGEGVYMALARETEKGYSLKSLVAEARKVAFRR